MPHFDFEQPVAINGASYSSRPSTTEGTPTLYRERHGWCPYSERIWLALEAKGVDYDTVYIDNIYGRPSWYSGDTPQMRWQDGKSQSESMDLVREVDKRFDGGHVTLYPDDIANEVINKVRAFRDIFPRGARPSSRAAFLFRYDGEPLWKNEFEKVLRETDELLAETAGDGPFFCGTRFTAADVAWAPFLERYAGQLPCLHEGLNPKCEESYPHLSAWYQAMDEVVPEYACLVRGDSSSWRKVLTMAGFGNAGGVPLLVSSRMDDEGAKESAPLTPEEKLRQQSIWDRYAATRPYAASSPGEEAASVLIRNREMIVKDIVKRVGMKTNKFDLPLDEKELDVTIRSLACILCGDRYDCEIIEECEIGEHVKTLASFLDERMCVPRDMGALSAACFKRLAAKNF
jgi:glutathione S-transferase